MTEPKFTFKEYSRVVSAPRSPESIKLAKALRRKQERWLRYVTRILERALWK